MPSDEASNHVPSAELSGLERVSKFAEFFERVSKRIEVFMDVETDTSQIELVFDQKFLDVSLHRYCYYYYY